MQLLNLADQILTDCQESDQVPLPVKRVSCGPAYQPNNSQTLLMRPKSIPETCCDQNESTASASQTHTPHAHATTQSSAQLQKTQQSSQAAQEGLKNRRPAQQLQINTTVHTANCSNHRVATDCTTRAAWQQLPCAPDRGHSCQRPTQRATL